MGLRYLGFDQTHNSRAYRFDLIAGGDTAREFVITADLTLFHTHRVGLQEGPRLCALKLASDLEKCAEGTHELTVEDLRAYADERAAAEARRAETRRGGARRLRNTAPDAQSPWRGPAR